MTLNARELHVLQHTLGVNKYGQGTQYRNHFCCAPGYSDYETCYSLAKQGYMIHRGSSILPERNVFFHATPEGRAAMARDSPEPPKLTRSQRRYQQYHNSGAADAYGWNFGDWLKYEEARRKERALDPLLF